MDKPHRLSTDPLPLSLTLSGSKLCWSDLRLCQFTPWRFAERINDLQSIRSFLITPLVLRTSHTLLLSTPDSINTLNRRHVGSGLKESRLDLGEISREHVQFWQADNIWCLLLQTRISTCSWRIDKSIISMWFLQCRWYTSNQHGRLSMTENGAS